MAFCSCFTISWFVFTCCKFVNKHEKTNENPAVSALFSSIILGKLEEKTERNPKIPRWAHQGRVTGSMQRPECWLVPGSATATCLTRWGRVALKMGRSRKDRQGHARSWSVSAFTWKVNNCCQLIMFMGNSALQAEGGTAALNADPERNCWGRNTTHVTSCSWIEMIL